jgi:hypothetical protein
MLLRSGRKGINQWSEWCIGVPATRQGTGQMSEMQGAV